MRGCGHLVCDSAYHCLFLESGAFVGGVGERAVTGLTGFECCSEMTLCVEDLE